LSREVKALSTANL